MGEIAEMMIEGAFCESCGVVFEDGQAPGYPRKCGGCSGRGEAAKPMVSPRLILPAEVPELRAWLVRNGWFLEDDRRGDYVVLRARKEKRVFQIYQKKGGRRLTVPGTDRDITRAFVLDMMKAESEEKA